jgi:hypothetical protein
MERMRFATLVCAAAVLPVIGVDAAPIPSAQLVIDAVMNVATDVSASAGQTPYNPRSAGGENYGLAITTPGFARYPIASGTPTVVYANNAVPAPLESRMILPFKGANATTYVLGAGGSGFQRLDYSTLGNAVTGQAAATVPTSFDWVDNDTIIYSSDGGGNLRKSLFLADVTANAFAVTANTTWNASGNVLTPAATRIRNVRVGDVYNGYAYFGDAGIAGTPKFWAIDLATGATTELGSITTTGSGSFGLWTVKEAGGYLYVHTTDDGINVYSMNSATSLGSLVEDYTKAEINALLATVGITGNQNWGFDVVDGGARMLLTAGPGQVVEIIPEPASLGLLGLAGLAMIRRRK